MLQLDPDTYVQDWLRRESLERAQKVETAVIKAYRSFGVQIHRIGLRCPEDRAEQIARKVNRMPIKDKKTL